MTQQLVAAYIASATIFFTLDFIWLAVIANSFYQEKLGHLLRARPVLLIAAAFYFIYIVGLVFFAIRPALQSGDASEALVLGALFGFFTYATYDVTNYATLKDWPLSVTLTDIAWGATLSGLTAYLATLGTIWIVQSVPLPL